MGQIIMKRNIPVWIEIDLHNNNSAIVRKFNIDFIHQPFIKSDRKAVGEL